MSFFTKDGREIEIRIECVAAYSGQLDLRMNAFVEGEYVGRLSYSDYGKVPSVQMIEVAPSHSRQGIATAMACRLQQEYPGTEIQWGLLTPDGDAFVKSLPTEYAENPEYKKTETRLAELRSRARDYERQHSELRKQGRDEEAFKLLTESDWHEVHWQCEQLENEFSEMVPGKKLIDVEKVIVNAPIPTV